MSSTPSFSMCSFAATYWLLSTRSNPFFFTCPPRRPSLCALPQLHPDSSPLDLTALYFYTPSTPSIPMCSFAATSCPSFSKLSIWKRWTHSKRMKPCTQKRCSDFCAGTTCIPMSYLFRPCADGMWVVHRRCLILQ